jgi:hypothetical protein
MKAYGGMDEQVPSGQLTEWLIYSGQAFMQIEKDTKSLISSVLLVLLVSLRD